MQTTSILGTGLVCLTLLAPSAQAELAIGTVAIYSDGDVEKLVAYDDIYPVWEDVRKRRFTQASTPAIPVLEYKALLQPSRNYQVSVISGNPKRLTTATRGQFERFKLRRQYQDGSSRTREWTCEVLAPSEMKLGKRRYPVDRYRCQRFTPHKKMSYPVLRETRLISYSQDLGLTMKLERETRDGSRARKLEYLLPPEKAKARQIARLHRKVIRRNN